MKPIPGPEVYEQELVYWPYRESLREVKEIICSQIPPKGSLIDLMCGPGYLLGEICEKREDLTLSGLDLDERYIAYARKKYTNINFKVADVLSWSPKDRFDVAICTGALHHIPYEKQANVIKKMASMITPEGFCIISDCYIDDYSNETERKLAAAKLGYEYLKATILNGAPDEVVAPAADVLCNDVMMDEFKTSVERRMSAFTKNFGKLEFFKTWPLNYERRYGDYITVLREPKK